MKQLVLLSGKGGTGKTSLAAAFAHMAHAGPSTVRAVIVDADVDAANLELALRQRRLESHTFIGGAKAVIEPEACSGCGECERTCRFDAILHADRNGRHAYAVDPIACEGCAACVQRCQQEAIRMQPQTAGEWYRSKSRFGPLFHAELRPAQENSGKLVTLVKQQARLAAFDGDYPLLIVDGPPGIGCPAISALSGADMVLVVVEPTAAGIHDMRRIIDTAAHFRTPALVCINKSDLNPDGVAQIDAYCRKIDLEMIGRVPFDAAVAQAACAGEPISVYRPESPAAQAVRRAWIGLTHRLGLTEQL